jgi:hypothetical protein
MPPTGLTESPRAGLVAGLALCIPPEAVLDPRRPQWKGKGGLRLMRLGLYLWLFQSILRQPETLGQS